MFELPDCDSFERFVHNGLFGAQAIDETASTTCRAGGGPTTTLFELEQYEGGTIHDNRRFLPLCDGEQSCVIVSACTTAVACAKHIFSNWISEQTGPDGIEAFFAAAGWQLAPVLPCAMADSGECGLDVDFYDYERDNLDCTMGALEAPSMADCDG